MSKVVMAAYRPAKREVALFVENGGSHAASVLTVAEARMIHGVLGTALRLADAAGAPLSAVAGIEEDGR